MDKPKLQFRFRRRAMAYLRLVCLLARLGIYLPMRVSQWVCEHSTQYRIGTGPWTNIRADLAAEARELANARR